MTTQPPSDHQLESFLRDEDSVVAGLYRKLPQPEPDAALNAAVRALARRAVATTSSARARHTRWMPALAAAAVIALAASVAVRMLPKMWSRPAAAPASQPASTAAQSGESSLSAAKPESTVAPAPPLTPKSRLLPPPMPVSAASAPPPPPAIAAPAEFDHAPMRQKQEVDNAAKRPAPRTFPTPAARVATPLSVPLHDAQASRSTSAAAPTVRSLQGQSLHATPNMKDLNASLYPEHWLANIRELLRDGKREEALHRLANFRKRYPRYQLPNDLRDLR